MAYTYSKTDWKATDRMTFAEYNRICANANAVFGSNLKADYTQDDILSKAQFDELCEAVQISWRVLNVDERRINQIESAIESAVGGLFPSNTLYPSDTLYPR